MKLTALEVEAEAVRCRHQGSVKKLLMEAKRIKEEAKAELTRLEQSFPSAAIK